MRPRFHPLQHRRRKMGQAGAPRDHAGKQTLAVRLFTASAFFSPTPGQAAQSAKPPGPTAQKLSPIPVASLKLARPFASWPKCRSCTVARLGKPVGLRKEGRPAVGESSAGRPAVLRRIAVRFRPQVAVCMGFAIFSRSGANRAGFRLDFLYEVCIYRSGESKRNLAENLQPKQETEACYERVCGPILAEGRPTAASGAHVEAVDFPMICSWSNDRRAYRKQSHLSSVLPSARRDAAEIGSANPSGTLERGQRPGVFASTSRALVLR